MPEAPSVTASNRYLRFGLAIGVIVIALAYLAFTGVQESKSYYVTIKELRGMGDIAHTRHLRVAGNVVPGSIIRQGSGAEFTLQEETQTIRVVYRGSEPPPDTFKDNSQALAIGTFGRDGVFHAKEIQAKCASKYAPAPGNEPMQQPTAPQQSPQAGAARTGY